LSFNYYLLSFIYAFLHVIQLWLVAIQLFTIDLPLVPEPAKAPLTAQQSAVTVQASGTSERKEIARLFPFYRQGAAAAGMRTSSRQPCKRFRPSAFASGLKNRWLFVVQWFTWLVTTTTELKPVSLNSLELLILLVYPVDCGQTRE